jgi:hypothetical protein
MGAFAFHLQDLTFIHVLHIRNEVIIVEKMTLVSLYVV